jgi:hypothetical protein
MSLAASDEDQAAGDELVAPALYKRVTASGDNEEPLVGSADGDFADRLLIFRE